MYYRAAFILSFAAGLCASAPARSQAPPAKSFAERVAEQRQPIAVDSSGRFGGPAWDALVEDAGSAQFTMVGEHHGAADIARLAVQLESQLIDRGYTHAAFEVGPIAIDYAEDMLRRGGASAFEAYMKRPDHGFVYPFLGMSEEVPMAAMMVARSPDKRDAIWGLDQEFVGSAPIFVDLFSRRVRNARQRAALDAFAAKFKAIDSIAKVETADIDLLATAFAGDKVAATYIAALRKTSSIYAPFTRGTGSGYAANLEREAFMKENFVSAFDQAMRRNRTEPRVFLKFGAFHAMRGFSHTNVPTLTNFLAEWGQSRGYRTVNLIVDCRGGKLLSPGGTADCTPILGPTTTLGAVTGADRATIVDLRPLRRYLASAKDIDAESRQIILAFDYYVSLRDVTPSTFVNRSKL